MRKFIAGLVAFFLIFSLVLVNVSSVDAAQRVKGYTKKNGTYVQPHYRSTPNKSKFDNYSTKDNINPFTGKKGTVNPFKPRVGKFKF